VRIKETTLNYIPWVKCKAWEC